MGKITHALLVFVALAAIFNSDFAYVGNVSAHENQCSTWADMIGKEGMVRDSAIMHGAGCDDGPMSTRHYDPDEGGCAAIARIIVNENPQYWLRRPRMLAAEVKAEIPACRQFEDGSYKFI